MQLLVTFFNIKKHYLKIMLNIKLYHRLTWVALVKNKITHQLERTPYEIRLNMSNKNIRQKMNFSSYIQNQCVTLLGKGLQCFCTQF
ncbi:hypothetical protein GAMM_170097 [Gammaproteobacteria bacterium]